MCYCCSMHGLPTATCDNMPGNPFTYALLLPHVYSYWEQMPTPTRGGCRMTVHLCRLQPAKPRPADRYPSCGRSCKREPTRRRSVRAGLLPVHRVCSATGDQQIVQVLLAAGTNTWTICWSPAALRTLCRGRSPGRLRVGSRLQERSHDDYRSAG